jgi:hypothetical protein
VAAIGAKELDLFVPKLLIVTIKFALALRARHPKDFRHGSSWRQIFFHHRDTEFAEFGIS